MSLTDVTQLMSAFDNVKTGNTICNFYNLSLGLPFYWLPLQGLYITASGPGAQ